MDSKQILFSQVISGDGINSTANINFVPQVKIIKIFDKIPNNEFILDTPLLFSYGAKETSKQNWWSLTLVTIDATVGPTAEERKFLSNLKTLENTVKSYIASDVIKNQVVGYKPLNVLEDILSNGAPTLRMALEPNSTISIGNKKVKKFPTFPCMVEVKFSIVGICFVSDYIKDGICIKPACTTMIFHIKHLSVIQALRTMNNFIKFEEKEMDDDDLKKLPLMVKNQIKAIKHYTKWVC